MNRLSLIALLILLALPLAAQTKFVTGTISSVESFCSKIEAY